jgi:hypothetical protein
MPRNILRSEHNEIDISINFGKFWKCGFYDWRLVLLGDDGRANALFITKPPKVHDFPMMRKSSMMPSYDDGDEQETQAAQGRFIVHAQGMRDHSFHEV